MYDQFHTYGIGCFTRMELAVPHLWNTLSMRMDNRYLQYPFSWNLQ